MWNSTPEIKISHAKLKKHPTLLTDIKTMSSSGSLLSLRPPEIDSEYSVFNTKIQQKPSIRSPLYPHSPIKSPRNVRIKTFKTEQLCSDDSPVLTLDSPTKIQSHKGLNSFSEEATCEIDLQTFNEFVQTAKISLEEVRNGAKEVLEETKEILLFGKKKVAKVAVNENKGVLETLSLETQKSVLKQIENNLQSLLKRVELWEGKNSETVLETEEIVKRTKELNGKIESCVQESVSKSGCSSCLVF